MNTEKEKQLKSIKNKTVLALSKIANVDDVSSIIDMLDELRDYIDTKRYYGDDTQTEYKFVCFVANKNAPRKPRKKKTNPSTK
jgi:uncharacterized protein with von Willebrand factor type A (vWA) domain